MSVLTLILAGGMAQKLTVLTQDRPKPMLPFGGKYRVLDFGLSNVANSGIQRVGLLAQYQAHALIEHVGSGEPWGLDLHQNGLQVWLASVERTGHAAYTGTADAVYQNRRAILEAGCEETLVIAADHVYKQDYRPLLDFHRRMGAELTIATIPRPERNASFFGQLNIDSRQVITHFVEKPEESQGELASLGIYVFNTPALIRRLEDDALNPQSRRDFGRDILPNIVADGSAYAYPFESFWADIGTLEAYWQASMALLADPPVIRLNDPDWPIRTRSRESGLVLVPENGRVSGSLLSNPDWIAGDVNHSVLSPGVRVEPGAVVRNAVLMENVVVGAGAVIEDCVLDQGVQVGSGAVICAGQDNTPNPAGPDFLSSGLSVIGARAQIPAGAVIGRNCRVEVQVGPEDFETTIIPSGSIVAKRA